jgi:FHA domain
MLYMDPEATLTELALPSWVTDDDVVQLREWGTDITYALPVAPRPSAGSPVEGSVHWFIGTSESCFVRLHDPARRISRRHAMISRDSNGWNVMRLSHNSLRVDGVQQNSTALAAGVEIEIGETLLIAESLRLMRLRDYMARILGWTAERQGAVDQALRAIRLSARAGSKLILRGEGDLVSVAFDIHARLYPDPYPFVLCGPPCPSVTANIRRIAAAGVGFEALRAARGGTLCVQGRQQLGDYLRITHLLQSATARVQTILCTESRKSESENASGFVIDIPSLRARGDEVEKVVLEYCADAAIDLGLRDSEAILKIREWVSKNAAVTVGDISRAAYRLVEQHLGGSLLTRARQFAS